jgi:hypothetical protein
VAANEHGQNGPANAPFDEDEDLFDFPIIEMTLDGLQERTPGSTSHQRNAPVQPAPPPALPKPAAAPVAASPSGPIAPAPVVVEAKPIPVPAAPLPVARVPDAPIDPPPETPTPAPRRSRMRGMRIALILLIGLNATGFWFLWRTHSTLRAGVDDLRAEIDTAAMRLERARRDATERGGPTISTGGATLDAVDALERTAIELATDEIRAGEYGAARRRLSRLLVRAERMSPGLRAEIEPRAAYLIAHSYHDEAQARTGAKH